MSLWLFVPRKALRSAFSPFSCAAAARHVSGVDGTGCTGGCGLSEAGLKRVSSRPAWDPVCWSAVRALCGIRLRLLIVLRAAWADPAEGVDLDAHLEEDEQHDGILGLGLG